MISRSVWLIALLAFVTIAAVWLVIPLVQLTSSDPSSAVWVAITSASAVLGFGAIALIPWFRAVPLRNLANELAMADSAALVAPVRVSQTTAVIAANSRGLRVVNLVGFDLSTSWDDVEEVVGVDFAGRPGLLIRLSTRDFSTLEFIPLRASALRPRSRDEVAKMAHELSVLRRGPGVSRPQHDDD